MSIARLFDWDVSEILAALPQFDEAWAEETWRQTMPYTPHRDSETIYLRRQPGSRPRDVIHQLASVATRHMACGPLAHLIDAVTAHVEGRPARAMLVRLAPGGRVTPHADSGTYADATERFHVALVTNPGAWFQFGADRYHVPAGSCTAFDKHIEHSAGNDGSQARTHLIVDIFPESPAVFAG
jgi:quercetin dioxygenase-like cupin family protein